MVSGRRTIRIRGIPSDKTRDDILTFVAACCSAKDTKSRGLSFPFFRGRSNESPIVISGVGSSTEVTKTPRDDGEHVHTINISRLPMSIAVLEDRTQIATITLTNHEYYSRCLKADGDPEFLVDGTFDGLTILSSPEAAEIDICAIHGLSGHAFESWMGTNKMWLRDLLPRESAFQKARIMTIGYNTKLFDHSTLASFQDLAHYVLTVVSMARRSAKDRPIIFVCHSLGGLVALEAMVRLRNRPLATYEGIKLSACGLLFLGTPFSGSNEAEWSNFLLEWAKFSGLRTDLVQQLKTFNPFTRLRKADFAAIHPELPFYCFAEGQRTFVMGKSREIVPTDSAGLLGRTAEQLAGTDHFSICKFERNDDVNFEIVRDKLVELYTEISDRQAIDNPLVAQSAKLLLVKAIKEHRQGTEFAVQEALLHAYNECFKNARLGGWPQAEASFGLVARLSERMLGRNSPTALIALAKVGWTLIRQSKFEDAKAVLQDTLDRMRNPETQGVQYVDTLVTASDLGCVLEALGDHAGAIDVLWNIPETLTARIGSSSFDTIVARSRLGASLMGAERYRDAEQYLRLGWEQWRDGRGATYSSTLSCLTDLGRVLGKLGRYDEAVEKLTVALNGRENTLPAGHPLIQETRLALLEVQRESGQVP